MVPWSQQEPPEETVALYGLGGEYVELAVIYYSA
jgi:hypothetical protein